jgi:hypothetical protein
MVRKRAMAANEKPVVRVQCGERGLDLDTASRHGQHCTGEASVRENRHSGRPSGVRRPPANTFVKENVDAT